MTKSFEGCRGSLDNSVDENGDEMGSWNLVFGLVYRLFLQAPDLDLCCRQRQKENSCYLT